MDEELELERMLFDTIHNYNQDLRNSYKTALYAM